LTCVELWESDFHSDQDHQELSCRREDELWRKEKVRILATYSERMAWEERRELGSNL
jgi:hypothetical protein